MRSVMEGISQWLGSLGPMYRQAEENKRAQALEASRLENEAMNRILAQAAEKRAVAEHGQRTTEFGWKGEQQEEWKKAQPLRLRRLQSDIDAVEAGTGHTKAQTGAVLGGEGRAQAKSPLELRALEGAIAGQGAQNALTTAQAEAVRLRTEIDRAEKTATDPYRVAMLKAQLAALEAQPGYIRAQTDFMSRRDLSPLDGIGGVGGGLPGASGTGVGVMQWPAGAKEGDKHNGHTLTRVGNDLLWVRD